MPQIILPAGIVFQSVSLALIDREEKLAQIASETPTIIPPTFKEKLQRALMPWVRKRNVDYRKRDLEREVSRLKYVQEMAQWASSKDMLALDEYEFELLQPNLPSR